MPDIRNMKPVSEWARIDREPYYTVIKRREAAGLGTLVPPHTWMLTRKEWEIVKNTPLPKCTSRRHD